MDDIASDSCNDMDPYREAHAMAERHGRAAEAFAARLEIDAHERGQPEEGEFWKKVRAALAIRS